MQCINKGLWGFKKKASFDSWLDKTTFLNSFDNFVFSHMSPLTPQQYTIMESFRLHTEMPSTTLTLILTIL